MPTGSGPTSPTPSASITGAKNDSNGSNNEPILARQASYDPTLYVQRTRVTRAAPPKPASNPLQFVQIKPCNLYQSAQEQLKRAEEVKKVKEVKKEEPEDWQSNLDSWKSCRRKRVEHIIDRVVEVKKLELEEHDKTRRKSKTFSEMLEERESKGRKLSLAVYAIEDDTNDLSDLGIGTSSASGKSSLSEDFDNHSVISDNQDADKANSDIDNHSNPENGNRDYVSSPGYDTSSSTAPASSPDPCEYTYEGAIQEYKTRVSRAHLSGFNGYSRTNNYSKDRTPERSISVDLGKPIYENNCHSKRLSVPKMIEERLNTFEPKILEESEVPENSGGFNVNLTNVNVLKRRELFEKEKAAFDDFNKVASRVSDDLAASLSIKERLMNLEKRVDGSETVKDTNNKIIQLPNEFSGVKDILTNIEKPATMSGPSSVPPITDVPVTPIQDMVKNIQSEIPSLSDEPQSVGVESSDIDDVKECDKNAEVIRCFNPEIPIQTDYLVDNNNEDSGIHTADTSICAPPSEDINLSREEIENLEEVEQNPIEAKMSEIVDAVPDVIPIDDHHRSSIAGNSINMNSDLSAAPAPDLEDSIEQDTSVIEALEQAFKAIDTEPVVPRDQEPIYENITEITDLYEEIEKETLAKSVKEEEPFYQVPKRMEPYYEVPKSKPIPLYENIDIFYSSGNLKYPNGPSEPTIQLPIGGSTLPPEPPKEKPPPPPVEDGETTDEEDDTGDYEDVEKKPDTADAFKRINSTRRIKKEIRSKRTSFLGIESNVDDENFLEFTVTPPPDMAALIQEERRLEKQMYLKAGLYDSSDTTESRDSGVSENHSRQSSDPVSEEQDDFFITNKTEVKNENELTNTKAPAWDYSFHNENDQISNRLDEEARMRCLEDQIREQEEVLRVERELLQLEQEELKRQQENLLLRENLARKELNHGSKMLMSANRHSLQNINESTTGPFINMPRYEQPNVIRPDYRQSMPNLPDALRQDTGINKKPMPPIPPAKPQRAHLATSVHSSSQDFWSSRDLSVKQSQQQHDNRLPPEDMSHLRASSQQHGNTSRHTIHALSAAPKPKLQENWVQNGSDLRNSVNRRPNDYVNTDHFLRNNINGNKDAWMYQQKRKSEPRGFSYNNHWLIQEAEQLRIDQQRGIRPSTNGWNRNVNLRKNDESNSNGKPLPDAIIQTLTQRVQNRGLGERKRPDVHLRAAPSLEIKPPPLPSIPQNNGTMEPQKEILSVSGKKKCSYCGEELGRGAAMIIESLQLFYHLDCFKCCVCRTQLGDGVSGADVRVRSQKLHCHNCFSSDDGIKFSCV